MVGTKNKTKIAVWCVVKKGIVQEWPVGCPAVYSSEDKATTRCTFLNLTPSAYGEKIKFSVQKMYLVK
jgi:hypothetical protein